MDEKKDIFAGIEAMLFSSGLGLTLEQISDGLDMSALEAKIFIDELTEIYQKKNSGLKITLVGDTYQMSTNPKYADYIKRINKKTIRNLTKAQMETLAIIAYKQPVTKQEIEQVRGVDSTHPVNKLLEYELVVDNGRLETPGRPMVFITTDEFLRQFGISNLDELPHSNL